MNDVELSPDLMDWVDALEEELDGALPPPEALLAAPSPLHSRKAGAEDDGGDPELRTFLAHFLGESSSPTTTLAHPASDDACDSAGSSGLATGSRKRACVAGGGEPAEVAGGGEEDARAAKLARNRESARNSRARRRERLEELEARVRDLERSNAHLAYMASVAHCENNELRTRLQGTLAVAAAAAKGRADGGEEAGKGKEPAAAAAQKGNECKGTTSDAREGKEGAAPAVHAWRTTQNNRSSSSPKPPHSSLQLLLVSFLYLAQLVKPNGGTAPVPVEQAVKAALKVFLAGVDEAMDKDEAARAEGGQRGGQGAEHSAERPAQTRHGPPSLGCHAGRATYARPYIPGCGRGKKRHRRRMR